MPSSLLPPRFCLACCTLSSNSVYLHIHSCLRGVVESKAWPWPTTPRAGQVDKGAIALIYHQGADHLGAQEYGLRRSESMSGTVIAHC